MKTLFPISRTTHDVSRTTDRASRVTHQREASWQDIPPQRSFLLPFAICYLLFAISYMLSACSLPGDAAPIVKIGVIAPFEGAGRPLGYAVLPAIKDVVAEANTSGELGRYRVSVVAFNDDLSPSSTAEQAKALALDPEVLGVIGPWSAETDAAAAPILADAGVPVLAEPDTPIPPPGERWGDAALADAATRAGDDARVLLAALAADIAAHDRPTRDGVADALKERLSF